MPVVQVVTVKLMEGLARETKRPYKMLIVGVLYTGDDGVVEMGEITFMERASAGVFLPMHLKAGQKYTPVMGAQVRSGKLQFEIAELRPIEAAAVSKAA